MLRLKILLIQDAGRSYNIKIDNSSYESVEQFKYLGTILKYQNSIQEEMKNRLKSWNSSCHSVQKRLIFSLLSKNIKIKIYRTINLLLFCIDVKHGHSY